MQLYLICHAESENNAKPLAQRVEDPPITALGRQQSEHLARWPTTPKIDTLITSPESSGDVRSVIASWESIAYHEVSFSYPAQRNPVSKHESMSVDPFERFERSRGGLLIPVLLFLLGAVPTTLAVRAMDDLVTLEDDLQEAEPGADKVLNPDAGEQPREQGTDRAENEESSQP